MSNNRAFTLVELLVVSLVLIVLVGLAIYFINPYEIVKLRHDADRMLNLGELQYRINSAVYEATESGVIDILCKEKASYPCTGSSQRGSRSFDGSGWVKAVLQSELPTDPVNDVTYHYTYCANSDGWEIDTVFESKKEKGKMKTDGGNEDDKFEIGTNLKLIASSDGSCIY